MSQKIGENIGKNIVARLRLEEDGTLSNKRVEQYALLRAEEVLTVSAAWIVIMRSAAGNTPSSAYQANIHKSPAFKARLEALMAERAELEAQGVWGRLEWQNRQLYRKCAAMNDVKGMQAATDGLMRVAIEAEKKLAREVAAAADQEDGEKRGRGAPPVPTPLDSDSQQDYFAERLISRQ